MNQQYTHESTIVCLMIQLSFGMMDRERYKDTDAAGW